MSFQCKVCSACCRSIGTAVIDAIHQLGEADKAGKDVHPIIKELACFPYELNEDLSCSMLNGDICSVYATRPTICNVDKMWSKYWMHVMTRQEHYEQLTISCNNLRRNHGSTISGGSLGVRGKDSSGQT